MNFPPEAQDGMCQLLKVQWTIIPQIAPQPWISCSGCGGLKPFKSSGKIRLNANGKRLDAWLIYKCTACGRTWNRLIFERQAVRDVNPTVLDALHANDPDWVRSLEFDTGALRKKSSRIEEFSDVEVQKCILLRDGDNGTHFEIALNVPLPTSLRLDRLLAAELGLPRSRLLALADNGKLHTDPDHKDALRRRISPGLRVILDLGGEADLITIGSLYSATQARARLSRSKT
jgi:hypothetical protein